MFDIEKYIETELKKNDEVAEVINSLIKEIDIEDPIEKCKIVSALRKAEMATRMIRRIDLFLYDSEFIYSEEMTDLLCEYCERRILAGGECPLGEDKECNFIWDPINRMKSFMHQAILEDK